MGVFLETRKGFAGRKEKCFLLANTLFLSSLGKHRFWKCFPHVSDVRKCHSGFSSLFHDLLATHDIDAGGEVAKRVRLFKDAARLIVKNALKYYEEGDTSVLPRSIATREAFLNAMSLDIAMGGSTNTILHLLAVAQEGEVDFKMSDIDALSRKVPCLCKLAPNVQRYSVQDCGRAGGILGILGELYKGGLVDGSTGRVDGLTLAEAVERYSICKEDIDTEASRIYHSAPANRFSTDSALDE